MAGKTSWPPTLQEINLLPLPEKEAIYSTLLPDWLYKRFPGPPVVELRCPVGSNAMELIVWHQQGARDPVLYINMVDTNLYQLLVLLVVVNDPTSPRFDVDIDAEGCSTRLGTVNRNVAEERRAMDYGLAPGQVRAGLRVFREGIPRFENFVRRMGHDLFLIEPLAYHNAILFERYGFTYMRGKRDMEIIHEQFQPGQLLHGALDGSTPFRQPEAWQTIRGRSWAIQDGVLGHAFSGFQMYKRLDYHAGVNTFPGAVW